MLVYEMKRNHCMPNAYKIVQTMSASSLLAKCVSNCFHYSLGIVETLTAKTIFPWKTSTSSDKSTVETHSSLI